MNTNVFGFFIIGALAFGILAARFVRAKRHPFKNFGYGLATFSLAFVIWAVIVTFKPAPLATYVALGVLPFVAGFYFLVSAATFDWMPRNRKTAFAFTSAFLVLLIIIRTWVLPSEPAFSAQGLIYFNAKPLVDLMYVLAFTGSLMTSVQIVSREIKHRLTAALTRIFFNLIALGGVILLVSKDDELQALNGILMVTGFIGLAVIYGRKKSALAFE